MKWADTVEKSMWQWTEAYFNQIARKFLNSVNRHRSLGVDPVLLNFQVRPETWLTLWKWKCKSLIRVWLFVTQWTIQSWNSPGQNTGVGSLSLLQGIIPAQGSTQVSHIAGRFFTSWATREAWQKTLKSEYSVKPCFDPKELWNNKYVLCYTIKYVIHFYASVYTQCSEGKKPGVEPGLWKWRSAIAYWMCWVWEIY